MTCSVNREAPMRQESFTIFLWFDDPIFSIRVEMIEEFCHSRHSGGVV
jgi:hypothetical protein